MQQDILDGMEYVLSRGIGNRDKLGIVGHSFGGFSALGALAFTLDLFQVGVAGAPPADLIKVANNMEKNKTKLQSKLGWSYYEVKELWANMVTSDTAELLHAQSPDRHASNVKSPLYMWAGQKDYLLSILDVRDYALRQRETDKAVTLMVDAKAGHNPIKSLSLEAYFYLFEKALADHLGGRIEKTINPDLARYVKRSVVIDKNSFIPMVSSITH